MPHVLLVEDDADIRSVVRRQLERLGCRVTEAEDGGAAGVCQNADPADVLLTDLVMPGKEGLETIKDFRRRYPDMRLVAMSGGISGADNYLKVAKAFGAASLLPKPFTLDELAAAVGVVRQTV